MTLTTTEQIQNFLNNHFEDNFSLWEVDSRIIWVIQTDGTGRYANQSNLNYSITGIIGKPVEVEVSSDGNSVSFIKRGTMSKKPYTMVTTVNKLEGGGYNCIKYWSYLFDSFLQNMDKMRGTYSYDYAVELSGVINPNDMEVATIMATQIHTLRKDVPDVDPNLVTLDIITEIVDSKLKITGDFKIGGEKANPLKWMWYINPAQGVIGTISNNKAAGEYVGAKSSFTVNTDFNDRQSFTIMHTKDVEISCYAQYKEQDGDVKMISLKKVIDLTGALPLYDYFGLM